MMPGTAKLLSMATALPEHRLSQEWVRDWAHRHFGSHGFPITALLSAYDNAGVEERWAAMPPEWYGQPHGWIERSDIYSRIGLDLMEAAARDCLTAAGMEASDVDSLLFISSTGVATPSLDALLMDRLPFREDVQRLPVFGLGCAGGVIGLGQAAGLAEAQPGKRVLLLALELCSLNFREDDLTKGNVIATVLFGDGAAAALVSCDGPDAAPRLTASAQHRWPESRGVMGWSIEEDGLGVIFSRDIPAIIRSDARSVVEKFLEDRGMTSHDIVHTACHPGGAKVVSALEAVLQRQQGDLQHEREVLRKFGNMSSPTALFVLSHLLEAEDWELKGPTFSLALGPGFTCAQQLLEPGHRA
jgi:alkylresorcinol/alkylpyrone synthase